MRHTLGTVLVVLAALVARTGHADDNRFILNEIDTDQGFCVVVGGADGRLAASLTKGSRMIVQACTKDHAGVACFGAGRSQSQPGGITLFGVDPMTGKIKWRKRAGSSGDMFVSDGTSLFHTGKTFQAADGDSPWKIKMPKKGLLFTTRYLTTVSIADFMATTEPNLSYKKHIELSDGRVVGDCIAFNEIVSVAGGRHSPGSKGYKDKLKRDKFFVHARGSGDWSLEDVKQQAMAIVLAIVLASDRVYLAGRPISYDPTEKSELWILSAADGKRLQTLTLDAVPVYDGLAAAVERLYLSTEDGHLACYGK